MIRRRLLAAGALMLLTVAPPALAGEPTDRLRSLFERANRVLLSPELEGLEERVTGVRALVNEVFDFEGAARLALGRHWEPLAPPARAEFVRLYADLIERTYLAWIGTKARVSAAGVTSRWVGESVANGVAMVSSVLLTRTGDEMPIDYLMIRRADQTWVVRDVVVDGLSLAANYHVQFGRVLQTESFDNLMARLREKAGPLARAQATAAAASAVRTMVAAPAPPASVPPMTIDVPTTAAPTPIAAPANPVPTARPLTVAQLQEATPVVSDATPGPAAVTPPPAPIPPASPPAARAAAPVPTPPPVTVVPAAPPARPAVERAAPARGQFWVQAGAFRSAEAASRLVAQLRRYAVTLALDGSRGMLLARVLVGPFLERTAAAATVRELQSGGIAAFIADTPLR